MLDVTATARAVPTTGSVTRAGTVEIATFVFDGAAKGPLAAPRVTGKLNAAGVAAPQGKLARLEATLLVDPLPPPTDPRAPRRFAVSADAKADGIAPSDAALARAIGPRADLSVKGVWGTDGEGNAESLRVALPTARGQLQRRHRRGRHRRRARRQGRRPRGLLRPRRKAARRPRDPRRAPDGPLRRACRGRSRREGGGASRRAGRRRSPARRPARAEGPRRAPEGRLRLHGMRADGARLALILDGRATGARRISRPISSLTDLAQVERPPRRPRRRDGTLTGSLARPDLAATLTSGDGRTALGQPDRAICASNIDGEAISPARSMRHLDLGGTVGRQDALEGARIWRPIRQTTGSSIASTSRSVRRRSAAAHPSTRPGLREGTLKIVAPDLDDLSPLVLSASAGRPQRAHLALTRADGKQGASHRRAKGGSLRIARHRLERSRRQTLPAPTSTAASSLDGACLDAERIVAFGQSFESVRLVAVGTPAASDIALTARGSRLRSRRRRTGRCRRTMRRASSSPRSRRSAAAAASPSRSRRRSA